jgi:hypothetical protein
MISSFHKASVLQGLALCTFLLGMALDAPARRAPELPNAPSAPAADTSLPTPAAQLPESQPAEETAVPPALIRKQKKELLKQNFEKMKRDAEELATLAQALQEELAKSNENVLSFQVVTKAEKIEKLAKRIKRTARGY